MSMYMVKKGKDIEPRTPNIDDEGYYVIKTNEPGYVSGPFAQMEDAETELVNIESGAAPTKPPPIQEAAEGAVDTSANAPPANTPPANTPIVGSSPLSDLSIANALDKRAEMQKKFTKEKSTSSSILKPPGGGRRNNDEE